MTWQDKDIWKAFLNGDKVAFEQLLLRYYRPMFEYGMRFQSDPDQLRDDLHDLLVNLWERREFLGMTDHLKLYLFKALRHQIFNGKRKKEIFDPIDNFNEENIYDNQDMLLNFEKEEINKVQQNRINRILLKLTKRQQEVLHLKFFEDLSNEQIADLMKISKPAIANLLYTSSLAFKAYWKAEFSTLIFLFNLFQQKI